MLAQACESGQANISLAVVRDEMPREAILVERDPSRSTWTYDLYQYPFFDPSGEALEAFSTLPVVCSHDIQQNDFIEVLISLPSDNISWSCHGLAKTSGLSGQCHFWPGEVIASRGTLRFPYTLNPVSNVYRDPGLGDLMVELDDERFMNLVQVTALKMNSNTHKKKMKKKRTRDQVQEEEKQ